MATIGAILQTEISFNMGSTLTPLLSKKDEGSVRSQRMKEVFEATRKTKVARIYDHQDIRGALGQSNRHTGRLKSQQTD
jgi:hypothetical protein